MNQLAARITFLKNTKQFSALFNLRHEALAAGLDHKLMEAILMAGFVLKEFSHNLFFGQQLLAQNYESMAILYYLLLSYLGQKDLYGALALIKKSRLLQQKEYSAFHNPENANYAQLLNLPDADLYERLAILVMLYWESLWREFSYDNCQDEALLLVRWFDLLNTLYELGYPKEMMDELQKVASIVFPFEEK